MSMVKQFLPDDYEQRVKENGEEFVESATASFSVTVTSEWPYKPHTPSRRYSNHKEEEYNDAMREENEY